MAEKEFIKWLDEHERKDRNDFASLTKSNNEIKRDIKEIRQDIKILQAEVQPMVKQDEHIQWLAQKVVKWMKVAGVVLALVATALGIYKGFGGK